MMRPSLLRTFPAFALAASVAACSGTEPLGYDFQKEEGEGELGIWVHSGLYNREYELHLPPAMAPGELRPLAIFLHGPGDTGPGFRRRLRAEAHTDRRGLITVWPSGMEGSWTTGCGFVCTTAEGLRADDVAFLETLVRHLARELPVDTSRVYLLGFSLGGQLAQYFACQGALRPAGIGIVGGLLYRRVAQDCATGGTFPVGVVHGDNDPIAWFNGFGPGSVVLSVVETADFWLERMGCAPDPAYVLLPDTAGDFTEIGAYRFTRCRPGASVGVWVVHEGGHSWPGDTGPWSPFTGLRSRNLDATGALLDLLLPGAGDGSAPEPGVTRPASPARRVGPATGRPAPTPSTAGGSPDSRPHP